MFLATQAPKEVENSYKKQTKKTGQQRYLFICISSVRISSFTSAPGVRPRVTCLCADSQQVVVGFVLVLLSHQLCGNLVWRRVKASNIAVFGRGVQTQGLKWRKEKKDTVHLQHS